MSFLPSSAMCQVVALQMMRETAQARPLVQGPSRAERRAVRRAEREAERLAARSALPSTRRHRVAQVLHLAH